MGSGHLPISISRTVIILDHELPVPTALALILFLEAKLTTAAICCTAESPFFNSFLSRDMPASAHKVNYKIFHNIQPSPIGIFSLSSRNQNEILGDLLNILRGYFDEINMGVGYHLTQGRVSRQKPVVGGWLPPEKIYNRHLEKKVVMACMVLKPWNFWFWNIFGDQLFWGSDIFMTSLWHHMLDVCTYFGMFGKRIHRKDPYIYTMVPIRRI